MAAGASPSGARWATTTGFVLAALGSAIGLGNIWRFAYVAGENGGGAFIAVYLVAVAVLGLPLLIAELAIGRAARADAAAAFARLQARRPWRWAGLPGIAASLLILAYHPVITGWVLRYFWSYASGDPELATGADRAATFAAFVADPARSVLWCTLVVATAAAIVGAGVQQGIERASLLLMPLFALVVLALAAYAAMLPGAAEAAAFLFAPDWSMLLRPATYLAATGQAFFSIGLAMGVFVVFGSYLPEGVSLHRVALVVAAGDSAVALAAGFVVFSAAHSLGVDPAHGPALAFVVLPEVFAALPGGRWVGLAFFLMLLVAALTSVVALLEVPTSLAVARLGWSRRGAALTSAAVALVLTLPAAFGEAQVLERLDAAASTILLPLSGIAVALFAGWAWRDGDARRPGEPWLWLLRGAVPLAIAVVLVRGIG